MSTRSKSWISLSIILLILILDQTFKIWVKTNFALGEGVRITNWFYLYFTENSGMAFGIELFNKLFLTLFRIIAAGFLTWYLLKICRNQVVRFGYCISISLIIAGALGNVIDCLFYGLIFNHSFGQVATLFPAAGGYAPFLYGKVVDMLYFPLIDTYWPDWMPFVGGDHFVFFRPVFNLADSAITSGIFLLLLFYRKELSEAIEPKKGINKDTN
jgi:signal peptidase II